ncbi:DMT family transporter [Bacillus horti]|uniref:Multidrug transporter EmrE-like cation transporter n=1 Tax=Caldalkalibacillus horti TaxID=77523 RepID=A0ABT9VVB3_9BACI|nr:SMR family transporter [Bacillus horti]MDQ0164933.1 multidrug transporter EmrE-like cation transporter [Bacillus horti]
MKRVKGFLIHTVLFIFIHVILFFIIHSKMPLPDSLEWWKEAAKEGKSGFYHESTGIYVVTLWAILYVIDGAYLLFKSSTRSNIEKQKEDQIKETTDLLIQKGRANVQEGILDSSTLDEQGIELKGTADSTLSGIQPSSWGYLLLGGMLEIVWAGLLKANLLGGPLLLIFFLSFHCLMKATQTFPAGTVYAVFVGVGAGGTFILDILLFGEPWSLLRFCLVCLLFFFIVLLKKSGEQKHNNSNKEDLVKIEWRRKGESL